jgi:hypothetical protein
MAVTAIAANAGWSSWRGEPSWGRRSGRERPCSALGEPVGGPAEPVRALKAVATAQPAQRVLMPLSMPRRARFTAAASSEK